MMPAGRPRAFDVDKALDSALELFWTHGYEGTSLAMLTEAMGINVPSLYAAFGNKETLFRKALERYLATPASYMAGALREPTARAVAEKVLSGSIELVTHPNNPGGCLLVQGAMAASPQVHPFVTH
jgi:AcrR family transcriptional regulator